VYSLHPPDNAGRFDATTIMEQGVYKATVEPYKTGKWVATASDNVGCFQGYDNALSRDLVVNDLAFSPAQLNDNFMHVKENVPVFPSFNAFKYGALGVRTWGDLYNYINLDGVLTENWLFSDATQQPNQGAAVKNHGTHSIPNGTGQNGKSHAYLEWGMYPDDMPLPVAPKDYIDLYAFIKDKVYDVKRPKKIPLGFKMSDLNDRTIEKMGSLEYHKKTRRIFAKTLKNCSQKALMDIMILNK
jgi:hypothetical protein